MKLQPQEVTVIEAYIQTGVNRLIITAHDMAKSKGWWDPHPLLYKIQDLHRSGHLGEGELLAFNAALARNFGEQIALIQSEASEALEFARKHKDEPSNHIPDYTGVEEELADILIRIGDLAGSLKLDLAGAVVAKMRFNETRPHRHGKKF